MAVVRGAGFVMRPWELVHRGRIRASAVLLDPAHLGEERVRRRVLALWRPGDRLQRLDGRWVIRFGTPRIVEGLEEGLPFVEVGGSLQSAPLREGESASLRGHGLVEVRGGEARVVHAEAADPSEWLELDAPVAEVHAVGPPPPPPRAVVAPVPVRRADFGMPDAQPGLEQVLSMLRAPPEPVPGSRRTAPPPPTASSWWDRLFGSDAKEPPSGSHSGGGLPVDLGTLPPFETPLAPEPREPGLLDGFFAFFNGLFGQAGPAGRPAPHVVKTRQDAILEALLERFDGDLEEALRHAIPLGGVGGLGPGLPAMRAPPPRERLDPALFAGLGGSGGGGFAAASSMYDALRKVYEKAARDLEAAGDIDKAAFVWADLLNDPGAAIDLLERHGRYALAATLAETRLRDWARAVRLHLLAGDVARALHLAQRHEVFAAALALLDDEASQRNLRAAWAALLVKCGRLWAAVDTVWDDRVLRVGAAPWLRRIVERGGPDAMAALIRWRALDPTRADTAFREVVASRNPEDVAVRTALGRLLAQHGGPLEWARPLAREMLADTGEPGSDGAALRALCVLSPLADLRTDLPVLPPPAVEQGYPLALTLEESGSTAVFDAVWLPQGLLCALGHAGAALLDRATGAVVWSDPTPVTHWVLDTERFLAVGVHPVGRDLQRLVRVDLRAWRVDPWVRARLTAWSDRCAQGRWLVADATRPMLVDLADEGWAWLVAGAPLTSPCRSADADEHGATLVLTQPQEVVRLARDLTPRTASRVLEVEGRVHARGSEVLATTASDRHVVWVQNHRQCVIEGDRDAGAVLALEIVGNWAVVARETPEGAVVEAFDFKGHPRGTLSLPGASRVGLRCDSPRLGVFDDRGRVVFFDVHTGVVRRRMRVNL